MATEKQKPALAAAREDVLSKRAMDALLNATPEDLVSRSPDPEVIKGNMNSPACWIQGPGMVEFNAGAGRRLNRVGGWAGLVGKKVERVHGDLLPDTKLVIIRAAQPTDLSAIQVNRYGYTTVFNLVDLLAEHGLQVETNCRERYEVAYIPKASKLWPGLVIDLSQPKERRLTSGKKEEAQAPAGAGQAATAKKTGRSRKQSTAAPSPAQQPPAPAAPEAVAAETTPKPAETDSQTAK